MLNWSMTGQGYFFIFQARIEIGRLLGNVITLKQVEYNFSGERDSSHPVGKLVERVFNRAGC